MFPFLNGGLGVGTLHFLFSACESVSVMETQSSGDSLLPKRSSCVSVINTTQATVSLMCQLVNIDVTVNEVLTSVSLSVITICELRSKLITLVYEQSGALLDWY